jgi:hypothetical protein
MSNGGGGGGSAGFHVVVVVVSAARAIDPNDVIAKLKTAATKAAATLFKVMTLPLSAPVAPVRRCLRVICSFDNITCGFDN